MSIEDRVTAFREWHAKQVMTIEQLIGILQSYPQHCGVWLMSYDNEEGAKNITNIKICKVEEVNLVTRGSPHTLSSDTSAIYYPNPVATKALEFIENKESIVIFGRNRLPK